VRRVGRRREHGAALRACVKAESDRYVCLSEACWLGSCENVMESSVSVESGAPSVIGPKVGSFDFVSDSFGPK